PHTPMTQPAELLATLVLEELASRDASNERTRIKAAGFPAHKTLDGFDLKASQLPRPTGNGCSATPTSASPARPASARATSPKPSAAPQSPPRHRARRRELPPPRSPPSRHA